MSVHMPRHVSMHMSTSVSVQVLEVLRQCRLPEGWASKIDPSTGAEYYYQVNSPETTVTWDRPQPQLQ